MKLKKSMKVTNIVGIALILLGGLSLAVGYTGLTYTSQEKVVELGDIKITASKEKTIPPYPIAGGLCLIVGIGLIAIGKIKR